MAEFWDTFLLPALIIVGYILLIVLPLLVAVAYLTLYERKVMAVMQLRKGPNVVGPFGLLQPLADGAKLFFKETIVPSGAIRCNRDFPRSGLPRQVVSNLVRTKQKDGPIHRSWINVVSAREIGAYCGEFEMRRTVKYCV